MSATVKLVRDARVVCPVCGQTVACAGRRVEAGALGDHLAARHAAPAGGAPCAGSMQRAPIAEAGPASVTVRRAAPAGGESAGQRVERWNREHPTGTRVGVTFDGGAEYEGTTVSLAWMADGGPVVLLDERDDPVRLDTMRALRHDERLPPVPPLERKERRRARPRP
jgi:hypothetical protein